MGLTRPQEELSQEKAGIDSRQGGPHGETGVLGPNRGGCDEIAWPCRPCFSIEGSTHSAQVPPIIRFATKRGGMGLGTVVFLRPDGGDPRGRKLSRGRYP